MSLIVGRLPAGPRRPMVAEEVRVPASPARLLLARIGVVLAAIVLVGVAVALIALLLPAPAVPKRSPFGAAFREAAPSAEGWGAYLLALQARFSLALQGALTALKEGQSGPWPLIGMGFAYGIFHAAGPGHGKAVIAAYLASGRSGLGRGLVLSSAAAFFQACIAVGLVAAVFLVLKGTAATMSATGLIVERASFIAMAGLGGLMLWRKAGSLVGADGAANCGCGPGCDHAAFGGTAARPRDDLRELLAIAFAAGMRPCAGAIVLLVFAASQGLLSAGIAAVFAMALGTAITTGLIATLTLSAKALALRVLGGEGGTGWRVIVAAEVLAAAIVLVLGLTLLVGFWRGEAAI